MNGGEGKTNEEKRKEKNLADYCSFNKKKENEGGRRRKKIQRREQNRENKQDKIRERNPANRRK